jgi:hypothetical protein
LYNGGGVCSGSGAVVLIPLPQQLVNDDNGIRVYVLVSDGIFTDTINLSRQVLRKISEVITTSSTRRWIPVYTTAVLDTPLVSWQFMNMSSNQSVFTYDNTRFRIFRWYPNDNNKDTSWKWLEYADGRDTIFSLAPGKLEWMKTDHGRNLALGSGVTMSLKGEYDGIVAKSKNWSDFGQPFKFGIKLADIVKLMGSMGDSLQWYSWTRDAVGAYTAQALYIANHADAQIAQSGDDTIFGDDAFKGYTVYNPLGNDVAIRIPPVSAAMSGAALSKKGVPVNKSWCIRIIGRDNEGGSMNPLYCGAISGSTRYYLSPRSFSGMSLQLADSSWHGAYGHALMGASESGVYVYNVVLSDVAGKGGSVSYQVENSAVLPDGYKIWVLDGQSGATAGSGGAAETVTLGTGESKRRVVLAGPAEALKAYAGHYYAALNSFMSISPNPNNGRFALGYRLGTGSDAALQCRIYAISGRLLADKTLDASQESVVINLKERRVAPGVYIIMLNACDAQGKIIKTLKSKFTYMP